jgi:hypothetical protein
MTQMEHESVASEPSHPDSSLLEHIVAAASSRNLLDKRPYNNRSGNGSDEDDEEEELFEDGDVENHNGGNFDTAAEVLTELRQATGITDTTTTTTITNPSTTPSTSRGSLANPNMTATINSINAFLQSHLSSTTSTSTSSASSSLQPHKVRLSGPIRANINIRHGVWAPRLRCRKRKNLHAKDGIWIHQNCTLDHLVSLVKSVLPDDFEWDPMASPLRYQAVNDQSLQSLKTVNGTVSSGMQSLYAAFDLVRNRRSDGDNFILQLYVYGSWTVLLKSHLNSTSDYIDDELITSSNSSNTSSTPTAPSSFQQPPPKKKYQQTHFNQMQMMNSGNNSSSAIASDSHSNHNLFNHFPLQQQQHPQPHPLPLPHHQQQNIYTHPLSANPPVTFLPTVTLEMKFNGTFVPVEISRRSFVTAIRACSIPKASPINNPSQQDSAVEPTNNTNSTSNNDNTTNSTNSTNITTNNNTNNNTTTPPPSDV